MLGFIFKGVTSSNYHYFNNNDTMSLYSRMKFQKHKLSNLLESFDVKLTEWENMTNNGYNRIWDCGQTRWEWQI